MFKNSGPNNHWEYGFWDQKPYKLGTWTLGTLLLTCCLIRHCKYYPKKELHRSLQVEVQPKTLWPNISLRRPSIPFTHISVQAMVASVKLRGKHRGRIGGTFAGSSSGSSRYPGIYIYICLTYIYIYNISMCVCIYIYIRVQCSVYVRQRDWESSLKLLDSTSVMTVILVEKYRLPLLGRDPK